jgi:hypothetical protein
MLLPKQSVPVDRFNDSAEPVRSRETLGILPSPQACCCSTWGPPACTFDADDCLGRAGGTLCPGKCGPWC